MFVVSCWSWSWTSGVVPATVTVAAPAMTTSVEY
jgi:hypothetical protein